MLRTLALVVAVVLLLRAVGTQRTQQQWPRPEDCALRLPDSANDEKGPGSRRCISFGAVNDAFLEARARTGPRRPLSEHPSPAPDTYVGQLGAAVEETSRLLKQRFSLSRADVVLGLADVDTRWTDVGRFCPSSLTSRPCEETRFRRHDGLCNNLRHPGWGAAGAAFRRLLPPDYADSVGLPRVARSGRPLPNPRLVSTLVHREEHLADDAPAVERVTFMFVTWGQLLDHDLTFTAETKDPWDRVDPECCHASGSGVRRLHPNCLAVGMPAGDRLGECMELARSLPGLRPDCTLGPRAQFNQVTSFVDASTVYGSTYRASDTLRLLRGGLLREEHLADDDHQTVMPPKLEHLGDGCIPDPLHPEPCFLAGDNRANEQLGLAALHALLVREHNRVARGLAALNPHWDDERLFQEARHILAALVQRVTYNEFLPRLLSKRALRHHHLQLLDSGHSEAYNASLDATVPDAFATAAFRFGHSLLPSRVERRDAEHRLVGALPLADALQRPFQLRKAGRLDQLLLGMAGQPASRMDSAVTDQVTDHLFQRPSRSFGKDLAAINLARAREHGVPGYNHYRALCGLPAARTWPQMAAATSNRTAAQLAELYEHPDDVDLWSAGISEQRSSGSLVGPTFGCIIARTFRNLKLGDRYWFENGGQAGSFTASQLVQLRRITLARVLCDAGVRVRSVQARPMERHHATRNPYILCSDLKQLPRMSLLPWKEKRRPPEGNKSN